MRGFLFLLDYYIKRNLNISITTSWASSIFCSGLMS